LSREAAAAALSSFWILMTAGRFLAAWFVRRIAPLTLTLGLCAAMAIAFALVAASGGATDAVVRFAFAGAACSALFPLLLAITSLELPNQTARVSALFSAAVLLGLGIGSFGVGPLRAWMKLETIYRLSMIWPILLGVVVVFLGRPSASSNS
jgi:fucose permease